MRITATLSAFGKWMSDRAGRQQLGAGDDRLGAAPVPAQGMLHSSNACLLYFGPENDMPDVLQLALDRRRQLTEEVDKIDEFIRTAESLLRHARFQTLLAQRASNEAGDLRTALVRMNSEKEPAVGVQAAISKNGARASSS